MCNIVFRANFWEYSDIRAPQVKNLGKFRCYIPQPLLLYRQCASTLGTDKHQEKKRRKPRETKNVFVLLRSVTVFWGRGNGQKQVGRCTWSLSSQKQKVDPGPKSNTKQPRALRLTKIVYYVYTRYHIIHIRPVRSVFFF